MTDIITKVMTWLMPVSYYFVCFFIHKVAVFAFKTLTP
jgi:hypothetical protein